MKSRCVSTAAGHPQPVAELAKEVREFLVEVDAQMPVERKTGPARAGAWRVVMNRPET